MYRSNRFLAKTFKKRFQVWPACPQIKAEQVNGVCYFSPEASLLGAPNLFSSGAPPAREARVDGAL